MSSAEEALGVLQELGAECRIMAGGQSLMPLMNMRLVQPAHVVDINRAGDLAFVQDDAQSLRIGALVRQAALEDSPLVRREWPLLWEAVRHTGHRTIRNRGTVGGVLAHGDPASEIPAAVACLDGHVVVRSTRGTRTVAVEELYRGPFEPVLEPDEAVTEISLPKLTPAAGSGFAEIARRHGDFAIAGVAATLEVADGVAKTVRLAVFGLGPGAQRLHDLERRLEGQEVSEHLFEEAGSLVAHEVEAKADLHATAEYRRRAAGFLTRQALQRAGATANDGGGQ